MPYYSIKPNYLLLPYFTTITHIISEESYKEKRKEVRKEDRKELYGENKK
jgi:hypothetical protein